MRTILQDKFTGPNGTALAAHSPNIGGPWTDGTPGLKIQGNKLTGSGAVGISSAPMITKTARLRATIDLNGMDANSVVRFTLGDVAATKSASFEIKGDSAIFIETFSPTLPYLSVTGTLVAVPAGEHLLDLHLSPSRMLVMFGGLLLANFPRVVPLVGGIEIVRIEMDVAAGTFPLIENLLATS